MNKALTRKLQNFVLATNSYPVFRQVYAAAYKLAVWCIKTVFFREKGVRRVFLEERVRPGAYVFGSSDIDLKIVYSAGSCEKSPVENILARLRLIFKLFPFVNCVRIFDERQFRNYYRLNPSQLAETRERDFVIGEKAFEKSLYPEDLNLVRNDFLGRAFFEYTLLGEKIFNPEVYDLHTGRLFLSIFAKLVRYSCYSMGILHTRKTYSMREVCELVCSNVGSEFIPDIVRNYMEKGLYKKNKLTSEIWFEESMDLYRDALFYIDSIIREQKDDLFCEIDDCAPFRITSNFYAQETKSPCLKIARDFTGDIPDIFLKHIKSIVLSSEPVANHQYYIYVILKDGISKESAGRFLRWLAGNYEKHMNCDTGSYFKLRFPIVVTENMFSCLSCFGTGIAAISKHPLEHFFLERHSEVLYGEQVKRLLRNIPGNTFRRNMLSYATAYTPFLRAKNYFLDDPSGRRGIGFIVDLACGILPSTVLFFDKNLIVTTPKELLIEYNHHYRKTEAFNEFYNMFSGSDIKNLYKKKDDVVRMAHGLFLRHAEQIDTIAESFLN